MVGKAIRNPRWWVELFVLVNLGGLAPDIWLAHSMNSFRHWGEWIPLAFSIAAPVFLLAVMMSRSQSADRALGLLVGWAAVAVGVTGMVLHLQSHFFQERTLASLVYAAPFAAPLAYTGLGLLLILDRMVDSASPEYPRWILLLALGGFFGNFLFSVTDHASNGFFYPTEWIPVVSSALACGFLAVLFFLNVNRTFLRACGVVLLIQAAVGLLGFYFHVRANLQGPGPTLMDKFVFGTPALAPMLFPDLVLLSMIGLVVLYRRTAQ